MSRAVNKHLSVV